MIELQSAAIQSKAWPFEEAKRVLRRVQRSVPPKEEVVFQTGYGPSGLPHIGTFGEVARTTMVRRAFELISDIPTKLICFSDDMDGMRKIPENVPNRRLLEEDLNLPLSRVRDPFGTHNSFAAHNNSRLIVFLDKYSFDYEFASSTEYYVLGRFDEELQKALDQYDKIMSIMLPTLGKERQATYSPFLPISPKTGHVLQVPTLERNVKKGTILYEEPDGERIEVPVTGGHVKMQWKPDWAMRWAALRVDYEMAGKDLIDSVTQATKICRTLGQSPPETLNYELFNDELGQKISKSKGNGLSMEEWLDYAPPESLQYFMYLKPKTAKRLHFDVIPQIVDQYHQHLKSFPTQDLSGKLNNPVFHIHGSNVPSSDMVVSFGMLLNLVSVVGSEESDKLWKFIQRYAKNTSPDKNKGMNQAVEFAVQYYKDRIKPTKLYRLPTEKEHESLQELRSVLSKYDGPLEDEAIQSLVYSVGRDHFDPLRLWFVALYEVLLGASQGPRFGGFVALYGIDETIGLIDRALAGRLVSSS
ncbi:MAG: lysine--tRNA ligase [Aestuariivita sp.]|nr:lysine--tRNA ligase [Aestuariivita sp.]